MISKKLELEISVDNGEITVHIYEPKSGNITTVSNSYSPDEHPEFDADLGAEIYAWVNTWVSEILSEAPDPDTEDWNNTEMVTVRVPIESIVECHSETCDGGPTCLVDVPRELLKLYYRAYESAFVVRQREELGCSPDDCSFEQWFDRVYEPEDTDCLCEFARAHKFNPVCHGRENSAEKANSPIRVWNEADMVDITVYCDSSGLFTEEEWELENLCELSFPRELVKAYYEENRKTFEGEQIANGIPAEDCSFEKWAKEVYTADSTDGLCDFARRNGFVPRRSE